MRLAGCALIATAGVGAKPVMAIQQGADGFPSRRALRRTTLLARDALLAGADAAPVGEAVGIALTFARSRAAIETLRTGLALGVLVASTMNGIGGGSGAPAGAGFAASARRSIRSDAGLAPYAGL
jgi:hypothetical protein